MTRAKKPKLEEVKTRSGRRIPVDHLKGLKQLASTEGKSLLTFVAKWCHLEIDEAAHVLREAALR